MQLVRYALRFYGNFINILYLSFFLLIKDGLSGSIPSFLFDIYFFSWTVYLNESHIHAHYSTGYQLFEGPLPEHRYL